VIGRGVSFFLSLVLKTQVNHLGPKRLPQTVAQLFMMADTPVGKSVLAGRGPFWEGRTFQLARDHLD